jgi:hypothetical protein
VAHSDADDESVTPALAAKKLLAELKAIFISLTLEQRRQLKIVIGRRDGQVDPLTVEWLIDLGLVIKARDLNVSSPAGRYVASLY